MATKEIADRLPNVTFDMVTARMNIKLPKFERIGNVNVYRVGFGWGAFDKWWLAKWGGWKAFLLHRKNHYDIAWAIMASWGGLAAWWFSVLGGKVPRVPLAVTLQEGDEIASRKFGLVSLGWRFVLSRADRVTVISNYLGDLARRYGYRGRIDLVPNGVNIHKFEARISKFERDQLRIKNLKIKDNDILLITTSRLVEKNGVGDIIEALTFLPHNIKLMIVGEGRLESELRIKSKELGLAERVKFLGFVSHDNLPEYLHASDIFVRPSLSEGLGNSFLEAMAAGLPIIGTPVGGIPDFLTDRETGLFCRPRNPQSIAESVARLIADPDLKRKLIDNGKKLVKENYTWESVVSKMNKAFAESKLK